MWLSNDLSKWIVLLWLVKFTVLQPTAFHIFLHGAVPGLSDDNTGLQTHPQPAVALPCTSTGAKAGPKEEKNNDPLYDGFGAYVELSRIRLVSISMTDADLIPDLILLFNSTQYCMLNV
jgi:hypothetical protein